MNYEGPIVCKNCGAGSHTDDPQCDCTRFNPDFAEPDFQPFDREPYDYIAALKARIAELEKNQVPEGWVAVPLEPTEIMEEAADEVFHTVWKQERERSLTLYKKEGFASSSFSVPMYRAMLAARGKP
jgi:hypothetical protein